MTFKELAIHVDVVMVAKEERSSVAVSTSAAAASAKAATPIPGEIDGSLSSFPSSLSLLVATLVLVVVVIAAEHGEQLGGVNVPISRGVLALKTEAIHVADEGDRGKSRKRVCVVMVVVGKSRGGQNEMMCANRYS